MILKYTREELLTIADEREQWARQAHEQDLHGSAKEWELTAYLARSLIELTDVVK